MERRAGRGLSFDKWFGTSEEIVVAVCRSDAGVQEDMVCLDLFGRLSALVPYPEVAALNLHLKPR